MNDDMNNQTTSPVGQFYNDKVVFITGATGFMGKVLVEKLLRCTNVKQIYLLIRHKKGVETKERLKTLLNSRVFDRLRSMGSDSLDKVYAVNGDITEDRLGLDSQSESLLASTVNIVFHCAATVRFDEDLSKSISMNVSGVLSVLQLADKMEHLEALVDISTAYANCDKKDIEEKVYPLNSDPQELIDMAKTMDAKVLDSPEVTRDIIGGRPNTYCFTKALAEKVLETVGSELPIAIFRPSIVTASLREPVPGWVDNFNGPSGMMGGVGKGVLRTHYCRRDCVADFVPVDLCINMICCSAWWTATRREKTASPLVYNFTSGAVNPITWGQLEIWGLDSLLRIPFEGLMWYPGGSYKENWYINRMWQIFYHYGPYSLVDVVMRLLGKKPFLCKISNIMQKTSKALEPFTVNSWNWTRDNVDMLDKELTIQDRKVFGFDVRDVDWPVYFDIYVEGIRKFLFNENPSTIPMAKRHLSLMYGLDIFVKVSFILGCLFMFYRIFC